MIKFIFTVILFSSILSCLFLQLGKNQGIKDKLLNQKLTVLKKQANEINTIFIGASTTNSGIKTTHFDSIMHLHNYNSNSYNFGIPGINIPEMQYVLEMILGQDLPHLQTIILEVNDLSFELNEQQLNSWRVINYHDGKRTLALLTGIWHSSYSLTDKCRLSKTRLNLFCKRFSHAGKLKDIFHSFSQHPNQLNRAEINRTMRLKGYSPLDETKNINDRKRRETFLSKSGQQKYKAFLKNSQRPEKLTEKYQLARTATYPFLADILEKCSAHGINVILLNSPSDGRWSHIVNQLKAEQNKHPIIEMNLPGKYPALFAVENRFDTYHLNDRGAKIATKILAEIIIDQEIRLLGY